MGLIAHPQGYPLLCHFADGSSGLVVGWTGEDVPVYVAPGRGYASTAAGAVGFSTPGTGPVGSPPAKLPKISGGPRGIRP